jgi:ABC-type multidrug transport system ATPase subunit
MIICKNLFKLFSKGNGIFDINITLFPGKIYGILGYNGAGKTTLLRCLEGLYLPTSGYILHNQISTGSEKFFSKYRKNISYLPAAEYLYKKMTCRENIELATILKTGTNIFTKNTVELIKYFDLQPYLDTCFAVCSTGTRKKVQIIISLIGDINTIIWDEPNDGLDIISNIKLKNLLTLYKEKNTTIIISSHVVEYLDKFIDNFILVQNGRIIEQNDINSINSLNEIMLKYVDPNSLVPLIE